MIFFKIRLDTDKAIAYFSRCENRELEKDDKRGKSRRDFGRNSAKGASDD